MTSKASGETLGDIDECASEISMEIDMSDKEEEKEHFSKDPDWAELKEFLSESDDDSDSDSDDEDASVGGNQPTRIFLLQDIIYTVAINWFYVIFILYQLMIYQFILMYGIYPC